MVVANGLFAEQSTVRTSPSNVLEHCISNGSTKGRNMKICAANCLTLNRFYFHLTFCTSKANVIL